jgi:hypothetical protein
MIPHPVFIIILEKGLDDDRPRENCRYGSLVRVLIVGINPKLHLTSVESEGGGESRM